MQRPGSPREEDLQQDLAAGPGSLFLSRAALDLAASAATALLQLMYVAHLGWFKVGCRHKPRQGGALPLRGDVVGAGKAGGSGLWL